MIPWGLGIGGSGGYQRAERNRSREFDLGAAQFRSIARNLRTHLEGQNRRITGSNLPCSSVDLGNGKRITFLLIGGIPTSCAQGDVVAYDANRTCR